jgi:signal transduction histidine kinase
MRAQREFVANASHQLRTPLTGMKLRLESAIDGAPDAELRKQLEAADREVDRLAEIVDRLLVMAKQIEEGQPTRVDLGDSAARAVARWEERASRLGASLLARGEGGNAQGNPTDVDQILDNLLDNAIAYAPGEIVLETVREDSQLVLAVQDHGPGIPSEEREHVTDRFFRGRGAPSGGSGLGLAIARELAEKWGGSLEIRSPEGEGTRIELRLPASRS